MSGPIPTGCAPIDDLLGGGVEREAVTQIYGPPASGKTNLVLSTAVEVASGGDRALLIDTEGVSGDRLAQIAGDDIESVADRIVVSEAIDFEAQREAVRDAEELAGQLEVIALDSATGFYRLERDADDEGETLRDVTRQITHLLGLARKHDLAVVVTNQVYSDPDGDRPRPLGGHTLEHWSSAVLRLERFRGGNRRATLEKHRSSETGESVRFQITDSGLDGVEEV
ncbi:DNA repair and recombination protein RadB [Halococcoides cellulosivorans]|uniref:DNA repair and recombination protein RadB n=1 Tax=Halococcoides cellulosivorans TaxID=1679096 RepID=A0A2R4WZF0_9EURY|nr:DNA repair and recombination protein RadB [Halococcoides cellulosivorans]AWB26895.1 DNA repair and recombination protein RadB [Halococcoides cellulosivorans]